MNALPRKIYLMIKNDANINVTYNGANWATQIKSILETHGFGDIWLNQSASVPFPVIKQRILDTYYQSWHAEVNISQRLSSYCQFKHSFLQENYFNSIIEKKYRIALTMSVSQLIAWSLKEEGLKIFLEQNENVFSVI